MINIDIVRNDPARLKAALQRRRMESSIVDQLKELDEKWRSILTEAEVLKAERNKVSKEIGKIKEKAKREEKIKQMKGVADRISQLDEKTKTVEAELNGLIATVPNLPDESIPDGDDENANGVVRTVGEKPAFDFEPLPHWELGPKLGIIDFDQGVKITGSRFYVLSGAGARLQRALISWMLDLHIRQGYLEKYTPFMVKSDTLFASGQLPKFADNLYKDHEEDLWMVPTAEVPLTGIHMNDFFDYETLPQRYTALPAGKN
jgi:seryl-tRNA synthetase